MEGKIMGKPTYSYVEMLDLITEAKDERELETITNILNDEKRNYCQLDIYLLGFLITAKNRVFKRETP
jgi:hypothetical protein